MTEHLGGPESPAKLLDRQRRYEALGAREPAAGRMFRIEWLTPDHESGHPGPDTPARPAGPSPAPAVTVGSIGFWEREWRGEAVYETGRAVLPEFQGRGLAAAALTELSPTSAPTAPATASTPSPEPTTRPPTPSAGAPASPTWATSTSNTRPASPTRPATGATA
ncbi:hypothetical protein AB0O18_20280 [Streptomyces sp. NPDC093224]|uniref:hypothetical protein n=1 Tax=Streptomyces sp. NPDC093224 TaxID=3155198 RepID=UPI003431930D